MREAGFILVQCFGNTVSCGMEGMMVGETPPVVVGTGNMTVGSFTHLSRPRIRKPDIDFDVKAHPQ